MPSVDDDVSRRDSQSSADSNDGNHELCPLSQQPDTNDQDESDDDVPILQLRAAAQATKKPTTTNKSRVAAAKKAARLPFPTTFPDFEPLEMDSNRCEKAGRPNLLALRNPHVHNPLGIFKLFVPTAVLEQIAINRNKYAAQKRLGSSRPWMNTNWRELQCFLGICIYMGIYRSRRIEDYWDKSGAGPCHKITAAMTLMRFQRIKRFLHICDPGGDNGQSYFFDKVEPLLSTVIGACRHLWVPGYKLSADEMMVMNYGRSSETVRMKNKPIGSGFKIWSLCDSGYMYYAFPHSNRNPWRDCSIYKSSLSHASAVFATPADILPRAVRGSSMTKMYVIFMDNFFSTLKLFRMLREKDIGAVGTVRSNAGGFPKSLVIRGDKNVKLM